MHRRHRRKEGGPWGARVGAAIFAVSSAGCSAGAEGLSSLPCPIDADQCVSMSDAASDDSNVRTPPSDGGGVDAAATRSPLCGVAGCYPGNLSACGATPPPDSGSSAPEASSGDGDHDGSDALVEQGPESGAGTDASRDGSSTSTG